MFQEKVIYLHDDDAAKCLWIFFEGHSLNQMISQDSKVVLQRYLQVQGLYEGGVRHGVLPRLLRLHGPRLRGLLCIFPSAWHHRPGIIGTTELVQLYYNKYISIQELRNAQPKMTCPFTIIFPRSTLSHV